MHDKVHSDEMVDGQSTDMNRAVTASRRTVLKSVAGVGTLAAGIGVSVGSAAASDTPEPPEKFTDE